MVANVIRSDLADFPSYLRVLGRANSMLIPANRHKGAWKPNKALHPMLDSSAPAITAPNETPVVIPELIKPMKNPLLSIGVYCTAIMVAVIKQLPAPAPLTILPTRNCDRSNDSEVITVPKAIMTVEKANTALGENMEANFPTNGDTLDIATRYEEVNQVACSNASKSAAIWDCVVVMMDMFIADMDVRTGTLGLFILEKAHKPQNLPCKKMIRAIATMTTTALVFVTTGASTRFNVSLWIFCPPSCRLDIEDLGLRPCGDFGSNADDSAGAGVISDILAQQFT
jgi:hypothetical protein